MLEALQQLFGRKGVSTDPADLTHWGSDWTRGYDINAAAIVFPEAVEQISALVRRATEAGWKLIPSGGRTGLSGGAVARAGEIVVSMDRMNALQHFDAADRLVSCQAGVVTGALQAFAQEQGLFYPVDFASAGSSQLGGNIATNAGGIKVIRYGLTRDWVAGLTVVTGTGDVLRLNQGLVKNATGYDLRHLFIGSEGTLGFIVEADMRLAPAPEPQTVMVLGVPAFRDLMAVLGAFQARLTPSAFEFFSHLAMSKVLAHRSLRAPLEAPCQFYALLEFDSSAGAAAEEAFGACLEAGWAVDGVISQSETQAANLWALREGISESIAPYAPYKNDLSVRVSQVPDFLDDVDRYVEGSYPELEVCWYGHIGDGNLHLNILKPDELSVAEFQERCHRMSPKIFELVGARGGSISAEHGVGLLKRDFLHYTRTPEEVAFMRGLKGVFDPNGVLNPGKLLVGA